MKIDSKQQFQPTRAALKDILVAYGLALVNFRSAETGIENCTLFIETNKGPYVLRIYRRMRKSDRDISTELDFIAYLDKHDVPVASALANLDGAYVTHLDGWRSILMPHIEGTHANHYNKALVTELSTWQAKLHQLALIYDSENTPLEPLRFLQDRTFLPSVNMRDLNNDARLFMERAASYSVPLSSGLPTGLCHLDYDIDNILVGKNDTVTAILDFDDLTYAPLVVCLGYTMRDVITHGSLRLAEAYLKSYNERRTLTDMERDLLPRIMLYRHYMLGAFVAVAGDMDDETTAKYIHRENMFLSWRAG